MLLLPLELCLWGMNASGFAVVGVNVIGLTFAVIHTVIVGTSNRPSFPAVMPAVLADLFSCLCYSYSSRRASTSLCFLCSQNTNDNDWQCWQWITDLLVPIALKHTHNDSSFWCSCAGRIGNRGTSPMPVAIWNGQKWVPTCKWMIGTYPWPSATHLSIGFNLIEHVLSGQLGVVDFQGSLQRICGKPMVLRWDVPQVLSKLDAWICLI